VGVVVKVSDLGGGVMIVESPDGTILQMRRVAESSRPVCAVPNGLSGAVVAFS
jgi:hypothetical protein